jgi:hypothetical protein
VVGWELSDFQVVVLGEDADMILFLKEKIHPIIPMGYK